MIPLLPHLWQSTISAAGTRYWLWVAAAWTFSLLLDQGGNLAWRPATAVTTVRPVAAAFAQPGAVLLPLAATAPRDEVARLPFILAAIWAMGYVALLHSWRRRWLVPKAAKSAGRPSRIAAPIPAVTPFRLEPGVFGVWRPVLLVPDGIFAALPPEQWDAVVAHEMSHVHRRDNFFAAVQMAVEALFWFHPLVWWIGARMGAERERACNEDVLALGLRPETYAEGILNVCEFYLRSPLPCASGVTGADLKSRIAAILTAGRTRRLSLGRKLLLAAAMLVLVALPVVIGVVQAQGPLAFDVASIRPGNPEERNRRLNITPGGGLNVVNLPLRELIEFAYGVRQSQILGGPAWTKTDGFNIVARVEKSSTAPAGFEKMSDEEMRTIETQLRQRVRTLLEDRFRLKVRRESREFPVLALTIAKGGLKIMPVKDGEDHRPNMSVGRGSARASGASMAIFSNALSRTITESVVDQTGLAEKYDFELKWSDDADGPSIYTALQEQLGLRLESRKSPLKVIVLESVERPSEN